MFVWQGGLPIAIADGQVKLLLHRLSNITQRDTSIFDGLFYHELNLDKSTARRGRFALNSAVRVCLTDH